MSLVVIFISVIYQSDTEAVLPLRGDVLLFKCCDDVLTKTFRTCVGYVVVPVAVLCGDNKKLYL